MGLIGYEFSDRVNAADQYTTVLEAAIREARVGIARRLIEAGADVNGESVYEPCDGPVNDYSDHFSLRTPLQAAVEQGELEVIELLLSKGARINAPAALHRGVTTLQAASIKGYLGIARKLLELGADCNAPAAPYHGRTALEGAAEHGRIEMIHMLLNQGVKTEGKESRQYYRAIKFAHKQCHYAAANLLRGHRGWTDEDHRRFKDQDLSEKPTPEQAQELGFNVKGDDGPRYPKSIASWTCPCKTCEYADRMYLPDYGDDDEDTAESRMEHLHEAGSENNLQLSDIGDHLHAGEHGEHEEPEGDSHESGSEEDRDSDTFSAVLGNKHESPNAAVEEWMEFVDFSGGQGSW